MKKISIMLLLIAIAACMTALPASAETIEGWAADSPTIASIITYVETVTDETSEDYIPPEARIVLFDSDGTLIGERYPTYSDQCMLVQRLLHDDTAESNSEDVAFAAKLEEAYLNHEPLPDSPRSTAQMAAESFAGFTVEEYTAYIQKFLGQPVPGFVGMTYGERLFVPMAELVKYLAAHDFQVYICSGTERIFLRAMIADTLGDWIPPYRVIGSTFSLTATGQGETADRSYTYAPDDQVLLEGNMIFKNLKMAKVISIVNEIGVAPVMVFGNSSGDFAMGQYALQHGGKAYMLLCDDTVRDYGDEEEAAEFAAECAALGFETVSMRDEFETIYAEGVRKAAASEASSDLNEAPLAVNGETSPDDIPAEDRIAVSDPDGTGMCKTYPFCSAYRAFADYVLNHTDALPEEVTAAAQKIGYIFSGIIFSLATPPAGD